MMTTKMITKEKAEARKKRNEQMRRHLSRKRRQEWAEEQAAEYGGINKLTPAQVAMLEEAAFIWEQLCNVSDRLHGKNIADATKEEQRLFKLRLDLQRRFAKLMTGFRYHGMRRSG